MTRTLRAICFGILLASGAPALAPGQVPPGQVPPGMARVAAGVYRPLYRGAGDLKEVPVKAFCLEVAPVTNEGYLEFVRANPRWRRSQVKRIYAEETYLKLWAGDLDPGTNAPANAPVTFVSWFAARAYAHWKGRRLPTVAEWEYAAAASPTRPDGENDPEFSRQVTEWYSSPSPPHLGRAGEGPKNFWGLRDLHGLVWEWAADFNSAMSAGEGRSDPGLDRELFCGGGAQGAKDVGNFPAFMRYGFRSSLKADYCVHNLGFRCASDL